MKVTLLVLGAILLTEAVSARAATVDYSYSGVLESGELAGKSFSVNLQYDNSQDPDFTWWDANTYSSFYGNLSIDGGGNWPLFRAIVSSTPYSGNIVKFEDDFGTGILFLDYFGPPMSLNLPTSSLLSNFPLIQVNFGSQSGTTRVLSTAAVPEPTTWVMLVTGFAAIGFAVRRRRQRAIAVSFT